MTRLAWGLMIVGLVVLLGLGWQSYSAYRTIGEIDGQSRIDTPNPLFLFNDLTASGIRLNNQIDSRSRGAYTAALEQFVLTGTGVLLGISFVAGGVFLKTVSAR
jgi:hypothetical protein